MLVLRRVSDEPGYYQQRVAEFYLTPVPNEEHQQHQQYHQQRLWRLFGGEDNHEAHRAPINLAFDSQDPDKIANLITRMLDQSTGEATAK